MLTTPRAAANAYQALQRVSDTLAQPTPRLGAGLDLGQNRSNDIGSDFASLVKNAVSAISQQAHATDQRSQAFANGRADLVDVVTAVAETGVAMDTLVSVRDRVISAYEDIMKMPI